MRDGTPPPPSGWDCVTCDTSKEGGRPVGDWMIAVGGGGWCGGAGLKKCPFSFGMLVIWNRNQLIVYISSK